MNPVHRRGEIMDLGSRICVGETTRVMRTSLMQKFSQPTWIQHISRNYSDKLCCIAQLQDMVHIEVRESAKCQRAVRQSSERIRHQKRASKKFLLPTIRPCLDLRGEKLSNAKPYDLSSHVGH